MAIPSRQIGQSTQANLLWQISKQLERLICVAGCGCGTSTTTSTTTITPTTTTTTTSAPITIIQYEVACQEYTWPVTGDTYFDSDEISYVDGNVTNILYLTICPVPGTQTETQTVTAVSPYIWPITGQTYTASGNFSYVLPCGDGGCIYYLELTIIEPTTTTTSSSSSTTTTTTTVIYSAGFSVGTANNALACDETVPVITLYSTSSTFAFGSFVYTDAGLTTIFVGGNLYYKNISANNVIRVPNSGQINSTSSC